MDPEEKERLKKQAELEEKYGHLADELEEEVEEPRMKVSGAKIREIPKIQEKRREKEKE